MTNNKSFYDDVLDLAREYNIKTDDMAMPDILGKAMRAWSRHYFSGSKKQIRTLSLFTGAGGLDIGFHDCGFQIDEMVEIEPDFVATLNANAGEGRYLGKRTRIRNVDINLYSPDGLSNIDFIIGGPPCQTFSSAGRRAAGVQGIDDPRGRLFESYVKLLKELKPRGFLFENVYGLIGAQGGNPWKKITQSFSDAGYKIYYRVVDAADYGVPQHRERVFIVGLLESKEYLFPRPLCGPDSLSCQPHYSAEEALTGLPEPEHKKDFGGRYGHLVSQIPPGLNYSFFTAKLGHPKPVFAWRSKFSDFMYKADPKKPIRTLKASGGKYTGPFHWSNRHFNVMELKRLQTFPDEYCISGRNGIATKQIGNSVPPNLARIMAMSILDQVFGIPIPVDLEYLKPHEELNFRKRKRELTAYYQDLAKNEHKKLGPPGGVSNKPEAYDITLAMTEKFDVVRQQESKNSSFSVNAAICGKKEDEFLIRINFGNNHQNNESVVIILEPIGWDLPLTKVAIEGNPANLMDLTKMWKALEFVVRDAYCIDDLVQLRGYYQYPPNFKICLGGDFKGIDGNIMLVKALFQKNVCGRILSSKELAVQWNVPQEQVAKMALELKSVGYEVRNSRTNPQISEDHYLIPYPFPTLNSKSVQINKSLD